MNVCTEAKADFSDSDNAWKKHLKYQTKTGQFEHTVCNLKEDRTRIQTWTFQPGYAIII